MKYEQVLAHYGGLTEAAEALGLIRQTVHAWGIRGRIPDDWQIRIAAETGLPADSKARRKAERFASYVEARNGGKR